jgi:hypothetical protein
MGIYLPLLIAAFVSSTQSFASVFLKNVLVRSGRRVRLIRARHEILPVRGGNAFIKSRHAVLNLPMINTGLIVRFVNAWLLFRVGPVTSGDRPKKFTT